MKFSTVTGTAPAWLEIGVGGFLSGLGGFGAVAIMVSLQTKVS